MTTTEPSGQPPDQSGQPAPGAPTQPAPGAPTQPPTDPPDQQGTTQPTTTLDGPALQAELTKVRQEAAAARNRLREIEQSQMSELEKATARAKELEETATTATADAARYQVALDHGLTADQASRLRGSTVEELTADVAKLRKDLGLGEQPASSPGAGQRPQEQVTKVPVTGAGAAGEGLPDMDQWMRQGRPNS